MLPEKRGVGPPGWSGDVVNAQYYLPEGESIDNIGYWYPADGGGVIGSDTIAVLRRRGEAGARPRVPQLPARRRPRPRELRLARLPAAADVARPRDGRRRRSTSRRTWRRAVVRPEDFETGQQLLQLRWPASALWDDAWSTFTAGGVSRAAAGRDRTRLAVAGARRARGGVAGRPVRRPVLRRAGRRLRRRRPDLRQRRPGVEPAAVGRFDSFGDILDRVVHRRARRGVFLRTFVYVGTALVICFLIGYPVAYYVARLAGRRRGLLLGPAAGAVLDQLPDADAGLGQPAAGRRLRQRRHRRPSASIASNWLDGRARHRRARPRLRLRAVLHPPAVRRARPHRPRACSRRRAISGMGPAGARSCG